MVRGWVATAATTTITAAAIVSSFAIAAPSTAAAQQAPEPGNATRPGDVETVILDGTGFGHGRGMSQWGAYGWAVDQGKSWQWILDHYYGGTIPGEVTNEQATIDVRLTDADGATTVGVLSHGNGVRWAGFEMASMYATEMAPGRWTIYGSDQVTCPDGQIVTVPSGDPPIARGSSANDDVRRIQRFLDAFHSVSIAVDGDFGPLTERALKSWQSKWNLRVDGVWNPEDAEEAEAQIAAAAIDPVWTEIGVQDGPVRFTLAGPLGAGAGDGDALGPAPDPADVDRGDLLGLCASNTSVVHHRGDLVVSSQSDGNRVVVELATEQYLRGVVPKEVSASWGNAGGGSGVNALRAQAVAARSYGVRQERYSYADTCDTQACQVYGGAATRSTPTGLLDPVEEPQTDDAIVATAGVVRRWPSGHPRAGEVVNTEFSASNGPRTAGGEFPPVDDVLGDGTERNPNHRWTREFTAADLADRYELGTLLDAEMVETNQARYQGFDGIWYDDLLLTGTDGTARIQAWDLRGQLGLLSPGFTVRVEREALPDHRLEPPERIELPVVGSRVVALAGAADEQTTVPESATAVAMNVAVVDPTDDGFVTVWPCSATRPVASNLNFGPDDVLANNVLAPIGPDGTVCLYSLSSTDLIADVSGWIDQGTTGDSADTGYVALSPRRLVDSRVGQGWPTVVDRSDPVVVQVAGQDVTRPDGETLTVPDDVAAVSVNVTATEGRSPGFLSVWPCDEARPVVSSVNYQAGQVAANGVISAVGADGTVCVHSEATAHVLVDLLGYFPTDSADPLLTAIAPRRLVDTREGLGSPETPLTAAEPLTIPLESLVPDDATAAVLDIAAVDATADGFLTVWPCDADQPDASNVNYRSGQTIANGVIAPIAADRSVCLATLSPTDVIVDLRGWFAGATDAGVGGSGFQAAVPTRLIDTRAAVGPRPAAV